MVAMSAIGTLGGGLQFFHPPARRQLVHFAATEADLDRWYTKRDLADATGSSHEVIRQQLSMGREDGQEQPGPLADLGVFDPKDPTAQNVLYFVNDETVETLVDGPIPFEDLVDIFESSARLKIVRYFLDNPTAEHTRNELIKDVGVGSNDGIRDNIDRLVTEGILERDESGWDTYSLDTESAIVAHLRDLDELVYERLYA